MVAQHQDEDAVSSDPVQKVIRKSIQISSPQPRGVKVAALGVSSCQRHTRQEFLIKLVGKPFAGNTLVVPNDPPHVLLDQTVKRRLHLPRRLRIPSFNPSRLRTTPGSLSASDSRLNASATPSSSSWSVGGSEKSRLLARLARSRSESVMTWGSSSRRVGMHKEYLSAAD